MPEIEFDYDEPPDTEQFILRLKNETDVRRRRDAAWRLGRVREDKRVIPALLAASDDADEGVRVRVMEALGTQKDPAVLPALIQGLNDEAHDVRARAVQSLGFIGDRTAIEPLLPLLNDENAVVRGYVADTLGKLHAEVAINDLLNAFLVDDSREVQHFAAESLKAIGGENVLGALLTALKTQEHPSIIQEMLEIIAALQLPGALADIQPFTEYEDTGVSETAKWAVNILKKL